MDNQPQETEENPQVTTTDQLRPASWKSDTTITKKQTKEMQDTWRDVEWTEEVQEKNAH